MFFHLTIQWEPGSVNPFPLLARTFGSNQRRNRMPFLLSCISTRHSLLKNHWQQTREQTQCPLTVLGSRHKPQEDQGGLLCLLDESGSVQRSAALPMPAGMALSAEGAFVASLEAIYKV